MSTFVKPPLNNLSETQKYASKQRYILFGFFVLNMLRPYGSTILPLFVLAGTNSSSLEQYFFLFIFLIALIIYSVLKYVDHNYPKEVSIAKYATRSSEIINSTYSRQLRTFWEKFTSAPSLMKCICFLEGWREAPIVKKITCSTLLLYGFYLLYIYFSIVFARHNNSEKHSLEKKVPLPTVIVLFISFFITLYSLYTYESPFFAEMVTNPTALESYIDDELKKPEVLERIDEEYKKKFDKRSWLDKLTGNDKPNEGVIIPPIPEDEKRQMVLDFHDLNKQRLLYGSFVLQSIFSTTFIDEYYPLHLVWTDMFRSSSDILAQLRTLSSVVHFHHHESSVRESITEHVDEYLKSKAIPDSETGIRQRNTIGNKRVVSGIQTSLDLCTIEQFSKDTKYEEMDWTIVGNGVLPPHVQINFLRTLHIFFMMGIGPHVGEFIEENKQYQFSLVGSKTLNGIICQKSDPNKATVKAQEKGNDSPFDRDSSLVENPIVSKNNSHEL